MFIHKLSFFIISSNVDSGIEMINVTKNETGGTTILPLVIETSTISMGSNSSLGTGKFS